MCIDADETVWPLRRIDCGDAAQSVSQRIRTDVDIDCGDAHRNTQHRGEGGNLETQSVYLETQSVYLETTSVYLETPSVCISRDSICLCI